MGGVWQEGVIRDLTKDSGVLTALIAKETQESWVPLKDLRWAQKGDGMQRQYKEGDRIEAEVVGQDGRKGWVGAIIRIVRGELYMIETVTQEDVIVPAERIRPWIARVSPSNDDFLVEEVPVSDQFDQGDFLKNHSERSTVDDESKLDSFLERMNLISFRAVTK